MDYIKKKILVIEDEELVRDGIVELLESEGFEILEAPDGTTGLMKAQQILPDLIICDVMMPGLSGFQVLENLQQEQTTATIPFIFLTAKSERSDMRYGMDLGADDFLTKPFKSEELFQAVQTRIKKFDKLESKSEEKLNELRYNIATILPHELRTPLNGILASSQLLMEYSDTMDNAEVRQLHENIHSSAKRLNRLIVNYLYYSELELLNKDKLRMNYFQKLSYVNDPSAIITEMFKLSSKHHERENDLHLDLIDKPILIFDDHLQKICEEIADNAFKFSKTDQKVIVKSNILDNFYQIIIHDFGRGMSNEQIRKVGAYVQFERNIYEQQGSGLGLIIAQKLLDIYKSSFHIESSINEYTKIIISIPLASPNKVKEMYNNA